MALFFELLFLRRYEQLLNPQVWDEDGTVILSGLIAHGLQSFLMPINGYLNSLPRLITLISLPLSFVHLPLVATLFSWAFIVATLLALSMSPTILRGGALLSVATLLVPSDAEVYGIPLYTFWFAGILIFIAALWTPAAPSIWFRLLFVAIGGLSSPAIFLAAPIFFVRVLRLRTWGELAVGAVALFCTVIQYVAVKLTGTLTWADGVGSLGHAADIVPKFVGHYLIGNLALREPLLVALAGWLSVGFFALAILSIRGRTTLLVVSYLWIGSIVLSATRANVAYIDAAGSAPRYFFYPFVFEGWLLIQLALASRPRWVRRTASVMLVLAFLNAVPVLNRGHDDLDWPSQAKACVAAGGSISFMILVQGNGHASDAWRMWIPADSCRDLAAKSLFR